MQLRNTIHKDSEHHDIDKWIVETLEQVIAYEHSGFSKINAWEIACSIEGERSSRTLNSPRMTQGKIWD